MGEKESLATRERHSGRRRGQTSKGMGRSQLRLHEGTKRGASYSVWLRQVIYDTQVQHGEAIEASALITLSTSSFSHINRLAPN